MKTETGFREKMKTFLAGKHYLEVDYLLTRNKKLSPVKELITRANDKLVCHNAPYLRFEPNAWFKIQSHLQLTYI